MKSIAVALLCAILATAAELPRKPADIDITSTDGQKITLEQYRGKVICLGFILTT